MTVPHGGPEDRSDRRSWVVLFAVLTVCFLAGLAFLVFSVWLDWS